MFERDYLVRMLVSLAEAIRKSLEKARGEKDYPAAANFLENSISDALDMDGQVLLSLSPDSISQVLKVSQTDPRVVIYVAHSMLLQAYYLKKMGNNELSKLREGQARAIAQSYKFDLLEDIEEFDLDTLDDEEFLKQIEEMTQ